MKVLKTPLHIAIKEKLAFLLGLRKLFAGLDNTFSSINCNNTGKRILFFSMGYFQELNPVEILLIKSIALRGGDCISTLCDTRLPLCDMRFFDADSMRYCEECHSSAKQILTFSKTPFLSFSSLIEDEDYAKADLLVPSNLKELESFTFEGIPFGELVRISLFHYLRSGTDNDTSVFINCYRKILISALLTYWFQQKMISTYKPETICVVNGLFYPSRILMEIAKKKGLRCVTYEKGYLMDTYIFDDISPAGRLNTASVWKDWKDIALTTKEVSVLENYFLARRYGKLASVQLWAKPDFNIKAFIEKNKLVKYKRIYCLFTNILWDAAVIGCNEVFTNLTDWISETIKHFITAKKESVLIIRIHPAEVMIPFMQSAEKVYDFIKNKFSNLPENIIIIPPDVTTSSYMLMEVADTIIVNSTIAGLEAACLGKPVIVVGKTHFKHKGFTFDPTDNKEYINLLDSPQLNVTSFSKETANRYAYTFFFRFMIKLPFFKQELRKHNPILLNLSNSEELLPGHNANLDSVCSFISGDSTKAVQNNANT